MGDADICGLNLFTCEDLLSSNILHNGCFFLFLKFTRSSVDRKSVYTLSNSLCRHR